jgi:hypothetical protein
VENQFYTSRIKGLQLTPALIRFLSSLKGIHWVIVGGESGPGARPVRPGWVFKIREQCEKHNVPFFFKQWVFMTAQANEWAKRWPAESWRVERETKCRRILRLNERRADGTSLCAEKFDAPMRTSPREFWGHSTYFRLFVSGNHGPDGR